MLAHRLRRWPNIGQTLGRFVVFAGISTKNNVCNFVPIVGQQFSSFWRELEYSPGSQVGCGWGEQEKELPLENWPQGRT